MRTIDINRTTKAIKTIGLYIDKEEKHTQEIKVRFVTIVVHNANGLMHIQYHDNINNHNKNKYTTKPNVLYISKAPRLLDIYNILKKDKNGYFTSEIRSNHGGE